MPEQFDLPGFGSNKPLREQVVARVPRPKVMLNSLFFAVFPDQQFASRIAETSNEIKRRHGLAGKLLEPARLHVTLHSLGGSCELPRDIADRAVEAALSISASPFDVEFDQLLSFRGSPGNSPLVLQASDGAPGLVALQQSLNMALDKAGLESQGMPKPHMTLLYDRQMLQKQDIAPIRMRVKAFALIYSHFGKTLHERIGNWALSD